MHKVSVDNIIDRIGKENLSLRKKGTYIFTLYDPILNAWHDYDTGMSQLSDATLDAWIDMGTDFVEEKRLSPRMI